MISLLFIGAASRRRDAGGGGGGPPADPNWPNVAEPPVANALILDQADELEPPNYATDGASGFLTID